MAGSKKHMNRSHRLVSAQSDSIFNDFKKRANIKTTTKEQKMTLGKMFRKMCPAARKDA